MGYLHLVYKFLRLGPLGLGIIAVVLLAGGYFLQVGMNKTAAKEAVALAAGPPKAVDIANFDRDRDASEVREVMVQAQPVLDFAYRLTIEGSNSDDHVFMVPLVAAWSHSETEILGIAYFPSPNEDFDIITPELLSRGMSGFGTVGPVITYNGKLGSMGSWDDLTEESFFDEGLVMPSNPVIVWPYMEGREVALAPPETGDLTVFGLLSKVAGAIGLFALLKMAIRKEKPAAAEFDETMMAAPISEPLSGHDGANLGADPVQYGAQPASDVPLWKQRSGLVDMVEAEPETHFEPEDFEPVLEPIAQPTYDEPVGTPRRRQFGVRKVLIGVVGGLFALGLVSTISDLVGGTGPAEVVAVSAAAEPDAVSDVRVETITPTQAGATDDRSFLIVAADWIDATVDKASQGDTTAMVYVFLVALAGFLVVVGVKRLLGVTGKFRGSADGILDELGLG